MEKESKCRNSSTCPFKSRRNPRFVAFNLKKDVYGTMFIKFEFQVHSSCLYRVTKSSPKKKRVNWESIDAVTVVFKLSRWTSSETPSLCSSEFVGNSKRTQTHGFVRVRSVNNSSPYHVLRIVSMLAFESESLTTSLVPFELVHFVLI